MKKIVSIILLIIIFATCLTACNSRKQDVFTETEQTETFQSIDPNSLYYAFSENNEEKIKIVLPEFIKDQGKTYYSSDFENGWLQITIGVKNTNIKLFTIYATNNNTYKDFENKENYKILKQQETYTVVWYEHKIPDNLTAEVNLIISEIKKEYNNIQNSIIINI